MRFKLILIIVGICSCAHLRAFATETWIGTYLYREDVGPDNAGMEMFVKYKLTIASAGRNSCRLAIDGYQSNDRIICESVSSNDNLKVIFNGYDGRSVGNEFGVVEYKPGNLLFTLRRTKSGLQTVWGQLANNLNETVGEYFKAVR